MKSIIVVLFALIFVSSAKIISLSEQVNTYEPANEAHIQLENAAPAPVSQNIPMVQRACTASNCNAICRALGFWFGVCVSSTTCRCYA